MKVAVTGAAGTLGRWVCSELLERGHEVRGIDIKQASSHPCETLTASLLERERCREVLADTDTLVHLANHPTSDGLDPARVYGENLTMNFNSLQTAYELGIRKVIFSSSIQVVAGRRRLESRLPSQLQYLPLDGQSPANAGNPYALSKEASESMMHYFSRRYRSEMIAVRLPLLCDRDMGTSFRLDAGSPSQEAHIYRDECFLALHFEDAARLIEHLLRVTLPGYRIYLPGVNPAWYGMTPWEMKNAYYPEVPMRHPREKLTNLCDLTRVCRDTGWKPERTASWGY